MEKLFEYASEYAKGYADVGYDEDQIASVRDAFIDGAKWADKILINKVCNWIDDNFYNYIDTKSRGHEEILKGINTSSLIEDLRKAMNP